jgi:hypothetical protein
MRPLLAFASLSGAPPLAAARRLVREGFLTIAPAPGEAQ